MTIVRDGTLPSWWLLRVLVSDEGWLRSIVIIGTTNRGNLIWWSLNLQKRGRSMARRCLVVAFAARIYHQLSIDYFITTSALHPLWLLTVSISHPKNCISELVMVPQVVALSPSSCPEILHSCVRFSSLY